MERPAWIPQEVVGAPLEFDWQGAREHIGPTEAVTPLLDRLASKTTCAEMCLGAGVAAWTAWRFHGHSDTQPLHELIDASFAFQVDWRYSTASIKSFGKAPDQPKADSAVVTVANFIARMHNATKWWDSYFQPVREVFHATHVLQHTLRKPFDAVFGTWLTGVIERLDRIAPKPDEEFRKKATFPSEDEYKRFVAKHRGLALPPQVLDTAVDYDPNRREELIDNFLRSLKPEHNRFLQKPEAMLELGFDGTPYRLA